MNRPWARAAQELGDGPLRESEREELIRLRSNAKEQAKRIVELEMEREVLKRCMVLWVK
ncbi:hypothetical protein [Streptomyces sp. NPDC005533]|uniref:hypothetical protein n=1 Tax=Streptomyces sp. NPDC005533 TaxID=3364723 RepID=UPI003673F1BF